MSTTAKITRFRTTPATGASPRVDRDAGVIRGASAAQAVEALGHGVMLDQKTLQQVVALGNAAGGKGLKVRFTHPGMCSDGLGTLIGHATNFRVEGDKALCDIQLDESAKTSPKGDLYTYVLNLAEKNPADFGLSIVFSGPVVWVLDNGSEVDAIWSCGEYQRPKNAIGGDLPLARVEKLYATDAVDEPAANRDGLFSAAFSATGSEKAEQAFAAVDDLLSQFGIDLDRAEQFAQRYLAARRTTPTPEPAMPKAVLLSALAVLALAAEFPGQDELLKKSVEDGDDEATVRGKLSTANATALQAKVADLTKQLAEKDSAHKSEIEKKDKAFADLQAKHDILAKLATAQDPGADAAVFATDEEKLRAQFEADPKLKANFGGEFKAYQLHIKEVAAKAAKA